MDRVDRGNGRSHVSLKHHVNGRSHLSLKHHAKFAGHHGKHKSKKYRHDQDHEKRELTSVGKLEADLLEQRLSGVASAQGDSASAWVAHVQQKLAEKQNELWIAQSKSGGSGGTRYRVLDSLDSAT